MRSELKNHQDQIDILVEFIEGRIDGPALNLRLATKEMQALLSVFEDKRYPATTNHFRRLDKQNRTSLGGLVNSEGIIEDFLQKAEVTFLPTKRFYNLYSLILGSLPNYVDPSIELLIENIVPAETNLSDSQKKKLIKERIKEFFRYIDKPPKWIQNPDWPIHDRKPLIFIGQVTIEAADLFHDSGSAYVFYDPTNGSFETVAQFY